MLHLLLAAALGLVDGAAHGAGDLVAVENRPAVEVPRRAADGLNQGAVGAQEAFLVGVQDRHQRHLGHIQALAQQVDTHQHVELSQPQVADDLHPLHGVDVRVQVTHLDAVLVEVLGKVLGHPLGQGGDQHPLAFFHAFAHFAEQVVHLAAGGAHFQRRVDQAGGPHHLLHHLAGVRLLIGARRGGHEHHLRGQPLPFIELQRPVVHRRGQPEAELHQGFLARAVALVHAAQLRNGHVGLVHDQQGVIGQVIEQGGRRLAGLAP